MHQTKRMGGLIVAMTVTGGLGLTPRPAVGQVALATSAARTQLNLGLITVAPSGSISYGGSGSSSVSSSWRALPSEARFNQMASGMLPSEQRNAVMRSGGRFFGGDAAHVQQRTPGTLSYSNPYARSDVAGWRPPQGAISPGWSRPSSPLVSSTRPMGMNSLAQPFSGYGSIRHGGAHMSSPLSRPMTAAPYVPQSPGSLAPLTRPLGASTTTHSFGGGGYGSIRYGGY